MRTSLTFALALTSVAVFAAGCGSESPTAPGQGPGATGSTVTIRGAGYDGGGSAAFTPGNLTVNRGTLVAWENTDTITHSVVSASGLFRGDVGPGGAFEHRFETSGAFPYSCTIHAGMAGTITVRQ
jgi:plastocyanin